MRPKKIVFFSYHYPPDQSAGATRAKSIVKELLKNENNLKIWVLCSLPRRYGQESNLKTLGTEKVNKNLCIKRFWIPYFGNSSISNSLSFLFYFLQVIPYTIFIQPKIIIATSAKLMTAFAASITAAFTSAKLFIDYRDTFSDNFFYFYRWHKKIVLHSFILAIENIVLRSAYSVNIVSIGFKEIFYGLDNLVDESQIRFTNFPNGIDKEFRDLINMETNNNNLEKSFYKVIYAGNLGEGQDILRLLKDLSQKPQNITYMLKNNILIEIYGSGSQLKEIKSLINQEIDSQKSCQLSQVVKYSGLKSRQEMHEIYKDADCLMLQLARFRSLSMVIPSKIFEYASTIHPIIFGASGFTHDFISEINGTIPFLQNDSTSLINAIEQSQEIQIVYKQRSNLLDKYDMETINFRYAKHILSD